MHEMIDDDLICKIQVKSASSLGDISAICLIDCHRSGSVYALIGTGAQVQCVLIHSTDRPLSNISEPIWSRSLPNNDQVHGIRKYPGRIGVIIVFGLHRCELWSFNADTGFRVLASSGTSRACILDAAGLPDRVALGTAHNTVRLYAAADLAFLHEFACVDRSLLYSLDLRCRAGTTTIQVAAGTVFGTVLTWSFDAVAGGNDEECPVEYRLDGHHGSVFDVRFSEDGDRICSASDDRTVRIWSLRKDDGDGGSICTGVGYGHGSRVWRAQFVCSQPQVVVTYGEDGTVRIWNLTGDELHLHDTISAHRGSIWAGAVHSRLGLIVTGAEDADLRLSRLQRNKIKQERRHIPVEIAARDRDIVAVYDAGAGRSVIVVRDGIVAITDDSSWRVIFRDNVEIRHSCMSPCGRSIAIVIGKVGVVVLALDGSGRHDIMGPSIFKVWMTDGDLFAFDGRCLMSWRLNEMTPSPHDITSEVTPSPRSIMDTSGANTSAVALHSDTDMVVTGDTRGSLTAFHADSGAVLWHQSGVHGRSVVKAIVQFGSGFVTMGADGVIRQYDQRAECVAALRSPNALAEHLYVDHTTDTVYTAGFNGANTHQYVICSVRGQNTFATFPHRGPRSATALTLYRPVSDELPAGAQFRYVTTSCDDDNKGQLDLVTLTYAAMPTGVLLGSTRHPFHTRRINDIVLLPDRDCFVSVGEDGFARLGAIPSKDAAGSPVCLASSSVHTDRNAIRCLCRVRDGNLIFTGGAKLQLLAFVVHDRNLRQLGRASGAAFDRRGKWFRRSADELNAERQSALDLRIMSMIVARDDPVSDSVTLVTGSSIGALNLYRFCRRTSTFSLLSGAGSDIHGHHPVLCLAVSRYHGIISADTRGRLVLWTLQHDDLDRLYYVTSIEHVHQSGVNCMAIVDVDVNSMIIVTGGDDHSLQVVRYQASTLRIVASLPGAHYAAVTGVVVLPHPQLGFVIFTCSPDRHIRIWSWAGTAAAEIHLQQAIRIACADAAALDVAARSDFGYDVIVSGQGMQYVHVVLAPDDTTNTHRL